MSNKAKPQHHRMAETGKAPGNSTGKPSARFYGEGGFVRHGNMAHTTHGAPGGYANKRSGGVKKD